MTASYELDLVTPTSRILDDLGMLSAVAVLGFTGSSAGQTTKALEQLAADPRWAFLDLRKPAPSPVLDRPVMVVVTGSTIPGALVTRIADIIDKRASGKPKLVVLCEAVASHAGLPRELARVAYSEFLPAP